MVEKGLDGFFEAFLRKGSVFLDKRALQSSYTPETIVHREEQTKQLANILAPILKSEKPSNTFVYGKTGTGKTLTVRHITQKITDISKQENLSVKIIYVNCKLKRGADTEYRLIAHLARELGKFSVNVNAVAPGLIETDMVVNAPEEVKQKALAEIVLGRIGKPDEVAWVVSFLASDKARHITGEVIKVDGGQYI